MFRWDPLRCTEIGHQFHQCHYLGCSRCPGQAIVLTPRHSLLECRHVARDLRFRDVAGPRVQSLAAGKGAVTPGLFDRRGQSALSLRKPCKKEVDRSQRYGHPLALAFLDLDDFKTMNDQQGHKVGDTILRAVVDRAREHLRKTDTIARVGGDEFVLLLPETDHDAAQRLVPRIHGALLDEMHRNHRPVRSWGWRGRSNLVPGESLSSHQSLRRCGASPATA
jgi:diguanylate cyclase (GGDEF)-like protein